MVADICIYIYIDLYYLVFSSPRPLVTSLRHGPLGGHSPWRIGGWSEEQPPLEPPSVVVIMEFMVIIMILVAVFVIVVVVLVLVVTEERGKNKEERITKNEGRELLL